MVYLVRDVLSAALNFSPSLNSSFSIPLHYINYFPVRLASCGQKKKRKMMTVNQSRSYLCVCPSTTMSPRKLVKLARTTDLRVYMDWLTQQILKYAAAIL